MSSGASRADDAAEQAGQLDRVVDAEVEAEPAERIVDVGGVAGEEHAALAEARRDALVDVVEIAVDDVVGPSLGRKLLQPLLGRRRVHQFVVGLLGPWSRTAPATAGRASSPLTLNSENQSSGSEM